MSGMGNDAFAGAGGNRLQTEAGYGLPVGARSVGTPQVGIRTSEHGRDYRVGYSVEVLKQGRLNLQLGIDAERRESPLFHLQEGSQGAVGRPQFSWTRIKGESDVAGGWGAWLDRDG